MSSTPEAAPAEVRTIDETGLSAAEVAERIAAGQTNATSQASSRSLWLIIKTNVFTRFNAILGALFVLILITGSLADGLFGVVLVVNSAIGIAQEYLAKRKLDRLALLNSPTTRVVRDGELTEVPTADVVLDDLIELRSGDQVPADGSMLATSGLEIDESNLTGEADAIPKSAGDEVRSGTTVVAGYRPVPRRRRRAAGVHQQDRRRGQEVHEDPLGDPGVGQQAAEVHHLGDRHRAAAAALVAVAGDRRPGLAAGGHPVHRRSRRPGARGPGAADLGRVPARRRASSPGSRCWCRSCRRSRVSPG